ncbi:hypothetical protein ZIOFF_074042 [Zingiber officinale]|uniref:NB-ARC domain-containing protein n=1 Tax=Zingiber officinale TaxID=94328 RepID=A0A8J5BCX0_ZINOF|nr:hypothetical protein ZIOFF_074042 [Zingiber officinale]
MCQSLQVDASDGQYQSDLASVTRETSSFLISNVLGREEEQKRIIELLLRSTDESASASDKGSSFSVIPLVGIGGVGKTTLAQLVYKDKEIQNHFALKIWIYVSENFNVQRLTKEIIESVTKTEHSSQMKLDVLQNILKEKIASKMIMLVLDDVWNEDEEWRKLCAPFEDAAAGSKAIVLGDLDEISFWKLFKQCAFGSSKPEEHPALVEIGRSIASKLKGLPLAAKTVGNLLGSNMNPDHWRSIMKSEVWELQQNDKNDIIPVLQLSYQYLSAPLKRCFAFCSLFQKNHEFSEIELTRMWMAEGFAVAQENQRMEDVASKYFHELVNMSLFPQSVSGDETSRMDNGKSNKIATTLRHLAVETEFVETKELRSRFKKLHSLFCQHLKSPPPLDFIKKLRSIRVLVLSHCYLRMLPTSVGESLMELPVLDELPDLGSLPCLKSLEIGRMSMLKHIDFAFCGATEKILLPRVETLVLHDLEALEELPSNLGRLPSLKLLKIVNISAVKQIGHGFFSTEAISKCFLSLERLLIDNMLACEEWCWIAGSELFPSLQKLTIYGCPKLKRFPPLPPSLTYLTLEKVGLTELPSLQELETNGSGGNQTTSSLKDLRIVECNNLTSLEEGLLSQNLSNIKVIHVEGCNELMRMPLKRFENFTSLKKLQIKACPKLRLTQEEEAALLPPSFKVFLQPIFTVHLQCHTNFLVVAVNLSDQTPKPRLRRRYRNPNVGGLALPRNNWRLQVRVGAMEEETIGCDAVLVAGSGDGSIANYYLLFVSPDQTAPQDLAARLQSQAGIFIYPLYSKKRSWKEVGWAEVI